MAIHWSSVTEPPSPNAHFETRWIAASMEEDPKVCYLFLMEVEKEITVDDMKVEFTYWTEEDGSFLGFLNEYPDHWTQGDNLEDLKEHLFDLHKEFGDGTIPGIRKVGQLEVA